MIHETGPTQPLGPQLEELVRTHYGLNAGEPLRMVLITVTAHNELVDSVTVVRNLEDDEDALLVLRSAILQIERPEGE